MPAKPGLCLAACLSSLVAGALLWCCSSSGDSGVPRDDVPSLKRAYAEFFLVGSMISDEDIRNAPGVVSRHCSIVTVNQFYFEQVHPEEDVYRWEAADRHIDFALRHGLTIRGHNLIWGYGVPDWVFEEDGRPVTRDKLIERMRDHIHTIVGRYRGKVAYWDVVNEATADIYYNIGDEPSRLSDTYKRNRWQQVIGDEYVELAFRFAHEADPAARLIYNDYNMVGLINRIKLVKVRRIVEDLLEKGVPVGGVGIQGHWAMDYPPARDVLDTIDFLAPLGLPIQVTELDLSVYPYVRWIVPDLIPEYEAFTPELAARQAERYAELMEALRARKDVVEAVLWWGLSDPTSWLRHFPVERRDWPLLFDGHYRPKPAFWAIMDLEPGTRSP